VDAPGVVAVAGPLLEERSDASLLETAGVLGAGDADEGLGAGVEGGCLRVGAGAGTGIGMASGSGVGGGGTIGGGCGAGEGGSGAGIGTGGVSI